MKVNKCIFAFLFFLLFSPVIAQELSCKVIVNDERVQSTERNVFRDMETSFAQFMNNTRWTNDQFAIEERISSNIVITIESQPSIGIFNATVQIQSARPIYNTSYETLMLNFADRDWQFQYTESQPLNYNDNTFSSNLTSMLAYYAYIIIGLDYDSFSLLGGNPFFSKALNIVTLAQTSNAVGWQPFDSNRNRYWLIENLNNQQMEPIRNGIYNYHRLGLDIFTEDADKARSQILDVLKGIKQVNEIRPNSILTISFFDAKSDEIMNIFSDGNLPVRREAYNILVDIDPTKTEKYKAILAN